MLVQTDGIVIKVNNVGESDRLVTYLTRDLGVIRAFVRGAKSVKSKALSATSLFAYCDLTVYCGADKYIVRETQPKEMFFSLREDLEKLALAQYFAQVLFCLAPEDEGAESWLRLLLNCLSFLCSGEKSQELIKAIFEVRTVAMAGFMPDISACSKCGVVDSDTFTLNLHTGHLHCGNCGGSGITLPISVVVALRHIAYAPFNKLFSFVLADTVVPVLGKVAEELVTTNSSTKFTTLDFYKSLHI